MRKYVWGVAIIIVSVLAYLLIPLVDCDPETKPDAGKAIEGIKDGTAIIRGENGCPVNKEETK